MVILEALLVATKWTQRKLLYSRELYTIVRDDWAITSITGSGPLLGIRETSLRGRRTLKDLSILRSTSTFDSANIVIDLNIDTSHPTRFKYRSTALLQIKTKAICSNFKRFNNFKVCEKWMLMENECISNNNKNLPGNYYKKIHDVPYVPKVWAAMKYKT